MTFKHWHGPSPPDTDGATVTLHVLAADDDAPHLGRLALAPYMADVSDDVMERATLLVSETVTNAVSHSGSSEVRLAVWRSGETIACVVADDGPGFDPGRTIIRGDATGGFGLPFIDTLARS